MSVTYGGVTLPYAHVSASTPPRRGKRTEYPGVDGVDRLDMGLGAGRVRVAGLSTGSPSRSTLEGMKDGESATLSADGDSYGNCVCEAVEIVEKFTTSQHGMCFRFVASFVQVEPD